jgi:hypothetical protein
MQWSHGTAPSESAVDCEPAAWAERIELMVGGMIIVPLLAMVLIPAAYLSMQQARLWTVEPRGRHGASVESEVPRQALGLCSRHERSHQFDPGPNGGASKRVLSLPVNRSMKGNIGMSLFHAVAFVDHQSAQVLQFSSEQVVERKVHEHRHFTRQHGSGVRSEHEFFSDVCDALDGIEEVLVVGGHTGLADFRHYVEKHRPLTAKHIVGYEVVDHPTEKELVALARKHFIKYDQMGGTPAQT